MRTDSQMMDLILNCAKEDDRIRAVYMNGSRTNPFVPKDIFQDFDVVYVVSETIPFIQDKEWIGKFGHLIMMQEPDNNDFGWGKDCAFSKSYSFLMLFSDGNRIDLRFQTKELMVAEYGQDKLTLPLMDKDGILPVIPAPCDSDYYVKKPSLNEYNGVTNEFWWCLQNVAKGIWRDELPYAKLMFEQTVRKSLDQMVAWWIGMQHDYQVSPGKMGKYFKNYLPVSYWEMYKETYSNSDYRYMWESIFISCKLFRILSEDVGEHFNFTYPINDDINMTKYLKAVRNLPHNATKIF